MDQKPFGTSDFALNPEPRCPCLLLLDVSGSMEGEPITELNAGLKAFRDELVADELASKRVEVACITFGPVNVATEFETAGVFQPPWVRRSATPRWAPPSRRGSSSCASGRRSTARTASPSTARGSS